MVDRDLSKEKEYLQHRGRTKNPRGSKIRLDPADLIEIGKTPPAKKKKKYAKGNAYQHTKTGARTDLGGVVVRSAWEANILRSLNLYKISWQFEPTEFIFPPKPPKNHTSMYIPDIYLPDFDEYIEVKGYLDGRGRNKLRKFKKYYPDDFARLTVIISRSNKANNFFFQKLGVKTILHYENFSDLCGEKVNWEGKR